MNVVVMAMILFLISSGPSTASPLESGSNNLMTMYHGMYSSMIEAMVANKVLESSTITAPMALFLMPNQIFKSIQTELSKELADPAMLKKFLGRHVVMQKLTQSDITNDMSVTASSGEKLRFNIYGKMMTVNGRSFMKVNIEDHPMVKVYRVGRMITPAMGVNLMDVVNGRKDRLSTLIQAIQTAGLVDTLSQNKSMTLFAPTNDAFRSLPDGALNKLMASPTELKNVLLGHVALGSYFAPALMTNVADISTMDGKSRKVAYYVDGGGVTIDGANIASDPIMRRMFSETGGVVHFLDRVLLP